MQDITQWVKEAQYFSQATIDKDNIPIVALLVITFIIIVLSDKLRKIFVVIGVLLASVCLGLLVKPVETTALLPFIHTQISMTRELGNDKNYNMYLSTGEEEDLRFNFADESESSLETWLGEQQDKTIYLRVDKGTVVVYDKELGKLPTNNNTTLYQIWQYWKDNAIVPEEVTRYKIWKFYLDS